MPKRRKTNTRKYRRTVFAVLEGDRTELEYVNFVRSRLPGRHGIEIVTESPGSARETLFRRAKEILLETDQESEVWIICDVDDEGSKLAQMTRQTFKGRARLRWAISNPEFALWLVMHVQDCTKWEDRAVYARMAKKAGVATGKDGKGIDTQKLLGKAKAATTNAAAARKRHRDVGRHLPDNNPQSDVDEFIARVVQIYNEDVPNGSNNLSVEDLY